jgi:bifunctional non-homologous end joining protein LigD
VAAVYAVRPLPGAPVSAPCSWAEIEAGEVSPQSFSLRTLRRRLAKHGELWAGAEPQALAPASQKLQEMAAIVVKQR